MNNIQFYENLLSIRPAQLGDFVKKICGIKRQYIMTKTGTKFLTDPVSILGIHLLQDQIHEPQMTQLFQILLRPNDVFIDIGGNEGYFSAIAANCVGNHGQVHCIEPQTRLQSVITTNMQINNITSVIIHNLAFSNEETEVELFLRPSTNTGASSMFRHWKLGTFKETVKTTTLDKFCIQNNLNQVRLIKIDCEGAEYLVIDGAKDVLQRKLIEFMAMEYHPTICGVDKCSITHNNIINSGYILTKVNEQCIYHLPGLETEIKPLGELKINCNWDE